MKYEGDPVNQKVRKKVKKSTFKKKLKCLLNCSLVLLILRLLASIVSMVLYLKYTANRLMVYFVHIREMISCSMYIKLILSFYHFRFISFED